VPLLTVEDLRKHITTSLDDEALQRMLDANEAAINLVAGPLGVSVTEIHYPVGYESIILTNRRYQTTTSPDTPIIVEGYGTPDARTLASDDFRVSGSAIRRLYFGTNPSSYFYAGPVAITGTPEDDTAIREMALVALCRLDVEFKPGIRAITVGKRRTEYQSAQDSGGDYLTQRNAILDGLTGGQPVFA